MYSTPVVMSKIRVLLSQQSALVARAYTLKSCVCERVSSAESLRRRAEHTHRFNTVHFNNPRGLSLHHMVYVIKDTQNKQSTSPSQILLLT